jgi:quinol monooxygenase YgiN
VIFIAVKMTVRPDRVEEFLPAMKTFTEATRAEPGNLFFEWSRSVDIPGQFVLLEAFTSPEAGAEHVATDHFKAAIAAIPAYVSETPEIINVEAGGDGWGRMAELSPSQP